MKRMQGGDIDDQSDDAEDYGFFSGEDLDEVELDDNADGEELEEEDYGSQDGADDYGDEMDAASYDDEDDQMEEASDSDDELIEKKPNQKSKGKKEKQKTGQHRYASYEEFAHLLEQ